jgi:hypothetical protein
MNDFLLSIDLTVISAPSSPSNLSSVTLVGSAESGSCSGSDKSLQGTDYVHSRCDSNDTEDTPILNNGNINKLLYC